MSRKAVNAARKAMGGEVSLPVDIVRIAKKHHIEVQHHELDEDVSGLLVRKRGRLGGTIAINPNQSIFEQRFTIAHLLGRFLVHPFEDSLIIPKSFLGIKPYEIPWVREANIFAANILMPEAVVVKQLADTSFVGIFFDEEPAKLRELADRFAVTVPMMSYRLTSIGLI